MSQAPRLSIFCANLARRKDRRFVMEQVLPTVCGVPLHFFTAVDGEVIPVGKLVGKPEGTTQSSYAVRLTKRLALRCFLRSDHDYLLYLEDDVVVEDHFDQKVSEAMALNHPLIFLGGNHHELPLGDGPWRQCRKTYNNHALLFSRSGAKKTLQIWRRWQEAWSDRELQSAILDGRIEAFCAHPFIAHQRFSHSNNWGNVDEVNLARWSCPMMLPDDLAVLDAAVQNATHVLEYGSGGSTIHLAAHLLDRGRLTSIEHNPSWFLKTQLELRRAGLHVDYHLHPPSPNRPDDGPWRYLPGQLDSYVDAPRKHIQPGTLDLVFIDGRERLRCARIAADLLKPGGLLLIHDFWSRERYRADLAELLEHFTYLFDTPQATQGDPQGLIVLRRKES